MPRLIDADAFIAFWNKEYRMRYPSDMLKVALANFPTIDPESLRPKGEWERRMEQDSRIHTDMAWCSHCGYHMIFKRQFDSFCPNCGADMRGDDDE